MSFKFKIKKSDTLNDVVIISPSVYTENRGEIWTSYTKKDITPLLPSGYSFIHDKFSNSFKHVLRGIHGDCQTWKLVSCLHGEILQVVVDMRESSSTYLKWEKFQLGPDRTSILVPPGMGNAFLVQSETATYHYKLAYNNEYVDADNQFTVSWRDPRLNISWPIDNPILSTRDAQ